MLNHKGTQIIETPRLILRPFTEKDAQMMYVNWASDPEVVRFLTWNVHPSSAFTSELLTIWEAQYINPKTYNWAIHLKEMDQAIGGISLVNITEEPSHCEVGYCLSKAHWCKGITAEALKAIIKYLFDEVGFERITAKHDVQNVGSGKVMTKCGMRFEGNIFEISPKDNETNCELAVYAIDRESYIKATEIHIDRPKPEDEEASNDFFKRILTYTFESNGIEGMTEDLELEIKTKIKYLKQDIESNGEKKHFLIAKMADKIVGTIEFGPANELITACNDAYLSTLPEIGSVFVDPKYHNFGIASKMLSAIYDILKQRGIHAFCLDSGYGNAQKVWTHKFGAPKITLKDQWGEGLDHMIWQVALEK